MADSADQTDSVATFSQTHILADGFTWIVQPTGGGYRAAYPVDDGFTADEALDAYVVCLSPLPGTELSVQLVGPRDAGNEGRRRMRGHCCECGQYGQCLLWGDWLFCGGCFDRACEKLEAAK